MKVTGRSLTLILRKPNIIISKQGVCNDHLRKIANGILEESIAKQSYEECDMDVDEQYVMRKELSNQLLETPSIQRLKINQFEVRSSSIELMEVNKESEESYSEINKLDTFHSNSKSSIEFNDIPKSSTTKRIHAISKALDKRFKVEYKKFKRNILSQGYYDEI